MLKGGSELSKYYDRSKLKEKEAYSKAFWRSFKMAVAFLGLAGAFATK
jgi:hypothetical protein